MRLKYILFAVFVLMLLGTQAECVQLKYNLEPGKSYNYTLTRQIFSTTSSLQKKYSDKSNEQTCNFSVKVINRFDNTLALDITTDANTFRRYIKENGALKTTVGGHLAYEPLIIEFSNANLQVGDKHSYEKKLLVQGKKASVKVNMLLKAINEKNNEAEILFSSVASLPQDKLKTKEINIKGKLIFDTKLGLVKSADYSTVYKLSLMNKAFAISRSLWNFETKIIDKLVFKNITNEASKRK